MNIRLVAEEISEVFIDSVNEKELKIINRINKDFFVIADENTLKSILRNLINNAIKFSYKKKNIILDADGFWDSLKNNAMFLGEKTKQFKDTMTYVVENIGDIVSKLVEVTWLYMGLFVLQIILLPLLMLWFMVKLVNKFFETK